MARPLLQHYTGGAFMKVQDIMTREPACVGPDATLGEVARLMKQEDCGSIPVVRGPRRPRT